MSTEATSFGSIWEQHDHSWEEVLTKSERLGGPTAWGSSRWSAFERCPYLYWAQHVKRMKPKNIEEALEVGGLYHECLARYYQIYRSGLSDNDCIAAMFSLVDRVSDLTPVVASKVRRLLNGWLALHGPNTPEDDRGDTLLIEEFCLVDKNNFKYSTRFDRVVWSKKLDGPCIIEVKTASRLTDTLLRSYSMDSQFLGQQYCWQNSNFKKEFGPLKGFVVDLAIKTETLQYRRQTVPVDELALKDWIKSKRRSWLDLSICEAENFWPKRRCNCVAYNKLCSLFQHCASTGRNWSGWQKKKKGEY